MQFISFLLMNHFLFLDIIHNNYGLGGKGAKKGGKNFTQKNQLPTQKTSGGGKGGKKFYKVIKYFKNIF